MNSLGVTRIQNDVLIPLVEKRPVLWDSTVEVPKRKKAKRKAWKDLCIELCDDFEEMDDEEKDEYVNGVKQRWQCLHDTFFKKKDSSGVKKYIYAEKMRFLDSTSCSNGLSSNELSKDVSKPDPPLSKSTDLVSLEEKTDNLDTLKNLKADDIEPTSSGDESFKSIQTSCSDNSMVTDKQHEVRFLELPKDRFSEGFLKNGFTVEPPKDRSTPKQPAKDLGFGKEASEEISSFKSRKKSKMSEDKLCTSGSSEDILVKNLELTEEFRLTDEPKGDGIQPKNGLPKSRFPEKLQNSESSDGLAKAKSTSIRESPKVASNLVSQNDVAEKTVDLKKGQKSNPENADPKNLTDDSSKGSSSESLKDVFSKKSQKNKPSKELSKKKSSVNQCKNKPTDQLPDSKTSKKPPKKKSTDQLPDTKTSKKPQKKKSTDQLPDTETSKKPQKKKSTDQLPDNMTSKRLCRSKSSDQFPEDSKKPHKNKHTDQVPEKKTSKRLPESKYTNQMCIDKLVEDSPEGNFLNDSSPDKSTNDLPQNGFTTKPSKLSGSTDKSTDGLLNEFSENGLTSDRPIEKLTQVYQNGFSSSDEPPVLEKEEDITLGQSSGVVNHLGSMRLKPELSSTFNLFLHSVTPHLKQLDQSEVLEFQMGVLQVIGHINERRKGRLATLLPQQFLDPQMPTLSES